MKMKMFYIITELLRINFVYTTGDQGILFKLYRMKLAKILI